MTVIAYRDGVMAGDRLAVRGSTASRWHAKIARRDDGALIGLAGDGAVGERYRVWFLAGEDLAKRPALSDEYDGEPASAGALVVRPDGRVEEHTHLAVLPFEGPYFAIGCGADFALAAMEMGADAHRAVEVACKLDIHCGGGIDTVHLDAARRSLDVRPPAIQRGGGNWAAG